MEIAIGAKACAKRSERAGTKKAPVLAVLDMNCISERNPAL
jgi:hypothetical protein